MSEATPPTTITPLSPFDPNRPLSVGLAVSALVCGLAGMCLPLVGLLGIIFGIIALTKASSSPQTHGGKGIAIAGIATGSLAFFVSAFLFVTSLGIMLPALGKARQSARQQVSQTYLRQIYQVLNMYAATNSGALPEPGSNWQARLQTITPMQSVLVSPDAGNPTATDSYIYIPGFNIATIKDPAHTILIYENPKYISHRRVSVIYADGHVDSVPKDQLQAVLDAAPTPAEQAGRPDELHPAVKP